MQSFDIPLSRERNYYLEKIQALEDSYKRRSLVGRNRLKGLHFRVYEDRVSGHYSLHSLTRVVIPFSAAFVKKDDGKLYFQGRIYPAIAPIIFLIFIFCLAVFLAHRIDFVILSLVFLALYALFFFKSSRTLKAALEEFFI